MEANVVSMIKVPAIASDLPDAGLGTPAVPMPDVAADSSRMKSLMQDDLVAPPTAIPPAAAVPQVNSPGEASLGDTILNRLAAAGENYRTQHAALTKALDEPSLSFRQLAQVQMRSSEMSMQVELFSKGVAKVLQHVDQLTKLQ